MKYFINNELKSEYNHLHIELKILLNQKLFGVFNILFDPNNQSNQFNMYRSFIHISQESVPSKNMGGIIKIGDFKNQNYKMNIS